jgi:hypothetical protein
LIGAIVLSCQNHYAGTLECLDDNVRVGLLQDFQLATRCDRDDFPTIGKPKNSISIVASHARFTINAHYW